MSRADTIEDLKQLLRELEAKKKEIESQYKAVAITIQLLKGDSSNEGSSPTQQQVTEGEEASPDSEDDDNHVPW